MRHLIFDLDATLYDCKSAYSVALEKIGISLEDDFFKSIRAHVKSTLPPKHVSARNRILYLKAYLEAKGEYSPNLLMKLQMGYEKAIAHNIASQWRRQNRDAFLKNLPESNSLAILTNETARMQVIKMQAIDPKAKFFKYLQTSEEVGVEKPDPKIFEAVLKRLKAKPQDCWMIGDSLERDIIPAMALGMKGVWTQEYPEESVEEQLKTCGLPKGCKIIKRLEELNTVLE